MFELLLQADRALANGALDQAERTYWQLVELDPTNSIALAGLARVWLERGDERSARTFADRALSIDPDSIVARRILEAVDHESPEQGAEEQSELPLLAAERLEALSRRHNKNVGTDDDGQGVGAGKAGRGRKTEIKATEASPPATEAAPAAAVADGPGDPGGDATATRQKAAGKASRGRPRRNQATQLPAEPLRERRQSGRLAAAAAAAAAAAREPLRPRHEPHHAMPIGRQYFEPAEFKAPTSDGFSAAEMAAAVEAVDAMDDSGGAAFEEMPAATPTDERETGGQSDLLSSVDATSVDDSVALRIALLSGSVDLEAAEREATLSADEAPADEASAIEAAEDSFEAAEAMAGAVRFLPVESDSERIVESSTAGGDSPGTGSVELADADAAEAAAIAEAMREVAGAADEQETEPMHTPRQSMPAVTEEPSEVEAEAQALREAVAFVLDSDTHVAEADVSTSPAAPAAPVEPTEPAEPVESVRKHGLFHRIRGS